MKNICILYSGGSYGTFIEWCLNYFSGTAEALLFNENGSSHKFRGNQLIDFSGCVDYVNSADDFSIVRFHPKVLKDENLLDNLRFVNSHFKKVIYLSPTKDSFAWSLNNKFEKVWEEGWIKHNKALLEKDIGEYSPTIPLEYMTRWELREFLSLYLYQQHLLETELEKTPTVQKEFTNFQFITLDNLRDNFKNTIISLLDYCQLDIVNLDKIEEVYQSWISYQYHYFKDRILNDIIESILNNTYYDWEEKKLTLIDETLVQYHLRQHNIEIKCYNLNSFPTNTDNLRTYFDYVA